MKKIEVYNPFNMDSEFNIITDNNKRYFKIENILLEISENGYIPKSGLLFYDVLSEKEIKNRTVLDLGCGYLGILGVISMLRGAKTIDAVDYDFNCVSWFNKLIRDNNFKIDCYQSDYFKNINNKKYDIILSNPPQMPMISGSVHDSGGIDGRKYILKIMKEARNYLNNDGSLYILMFDFLGIENTNGNEKSIKQIANELGYKTFEILNETKKVIKPGSVTFDSMEHILNIYPEYKFIKENDFYTNKIKIVRMKK